LQRRYAEALDIYTQAREQFESLGEPGSVAVLWHQIGMVHRQAGQFEQAEHAYRQSLAINVQQQNRADEAKSLGELGNLYNDMERWEDAVTFSRQAADIHVTLQDFIHEGVARSNLANVLIKLHRYDEARIELQRAIECKKPYGHAAEPWKTWAILHNLEQATSNSQAAAQARQKAVRSYLEYRRDGGENQNSASQLFTLTAQAIQQGETTEMEQQLAQYSGADASSRVKILIPKLQAIIRGDRDSALATDPNLDYDDAVELQLLLEKLGTGKE
jgi:tetratricopeptide (TPR) repeat protein